MTSGRSRLSIGGRVTGPVSACRAGPARGVRAANPASQPPPRRSVTFAKVSADSSTAMGAAGTGRPQQTAVPTPAIFCSANAAGWNEEAVGA